jgi:hypothetical protein
MLGAAGASGGVITVKAVDVALVTPVRDAVRVYGVPPIPVNVHVARLAMPEVACSAAQFDEILPPAGADEMVTVGLDEVMTLPPESSTATTGPVVKALPDINGDSGSVVNTSWVGTPGTVGEKLVLVADTEPSVAVIVYWVPTIPAKAHVSTVTIPSFGVKPEQVVRLPPDTVKPSCAVSAVTRLKVPLGAPLLE